MPRRATRSATAAKTAASVSVTRLHPLIQRELRGAVDLRRTVILRSEDGVAVDVIVRNVPPQR